MAHVHTASFPSTGQHGFRAGLFRRQSVSDPRQEPETSSCRRSTWAARSAASCVGGVVADGGAHQLRRRPAGVDGRAGQGRDQVGDGGVQFGRGDDEVGQPDRVRLGGSTARPVRQISSARE